MPGSRAYNRVQVTLSGAKTGHYGNQHENLTWENVQEKYVCTEEYFVESSNLVKAMDEAPAETILEQLQKQLQKAVTGQAKNGATRRPYSIFTDPCLLFVPSYKAES